MAESTFIAVTRQGIGGVESSVWVNVDAIAFIESLETNGNQTAPGATLHLRGIEDVTTMHVKDAVADLVKQLTGAAQPPEQAGAAKAPQPKPRRATAPSARSG